MSGGVWVQVRTKDPLGRLPDSVVALQVGTTVAFTALGVKIGSAGPEHVTVGLEVSASVMPDEPDIDETDYLP